MQRKPKPFWKKSAALRKSAAFISENVIEPFATVIIERARERNDIFDQSGPCTEYCACETCWLGWQLPNRTLLINRIKHIVDGEAFSMSRKFARIGNAFKRLNYELTNQNTKLELFATLVSGEVINIKVRNRTVGQVRTKHGHQHVAIIYKK